MFYCFRQNNSGGRFYGPAIDVWVEADNADEANSIALEKCDIYFDGVQKGWDCECCGDRWYNVNGRDWDCSEIPNMPSSSTISFAKSDNVPARKIYYKDGRIE